MSLWRVWGDHFVALLPITPEGSFDPSKAFGVTALGLAWSWIVGHVLPAYTLVASTIPLTLILFLWVADMITGMGASWIRGYRDPVTKQVLLVNGAPITGWRALSGTWARAGFAKLILWVSVLLIAFGLRHYHVMGGGLFAGLMEGAVAFWETGSVLKNLGRCFGHAGVEALGGLAEGRGDNMSTRGAKAK